MIEFTQYKEQYKEQVCNLIRNIMVNELEIDKKRIEQITKDLEDINKNYILNKGKFWIALDSQKDEVVGTVAIMHLDNSNAEFKRFYVKKDYRNKNIGHELYKIAEEYAKNKGFKYLYLASGKNLNRAHRIYNKNNWKLIDKNICNVKIFVRDEAKLFKKELVNN